MVGCYMVKGFNGSLTHKDRVLRVNLSRQKDFREEFSHMGLRAARIRTIGRFRSRISFFFKAG